MNADPGSDRGLFKYSPATFFRENEGNHEAHQSRLPNRTHIEMSKFLGMAVNIIEDFGTGGQISISGKENGKIFPHHIVQSSAG
jgi:hypothetical protein